MTSDTNPLVGIHLDLKYHMPDKRYLLQWLEALPRWGINAVLIEYEDKFPFESRAFLRDPDAFTPAELAEFLATARRAGLTVIPLVQSLSHLEFALGCDRLAGLREAPDIPTQACPSNPQAVEFILEIMGEVMAYHADDELFHCGGDEAWSLGTCPRCAARAERLGAAGLWADHQRKIARFVVESGKRPILWDDVFWPDPAAAGRADLPAGTILHAWDYDLTDAPDHADRIARRIAAYRQAGLDGLAAPCLNYGQLLPRLSPSIANTRAWAAQVHAGAMLGLVNTSWACFHVPLQAQCLLVAATGRLARDPHADVGRSWQQAWLAEHFAAPAAGAAEALETLGALWEISMAGHERPFTPLVYGYMNMILHFPGRQDERRRRGAYPYDWGEIDFREVYRKGIEQVRAGEMEPVLARLDEVLATFPGARDALATLAATATRHADEARMLAELAEMKLLSARVLSQLLRADGDPAELRDELLAHREPLASALASAWEPVGRERMLRAWWEPLYHAVSPGPACP